MSSLYSKTSLNLKLGKRLHSIRVKKGLTLTELSSRMRGHYSASTISQYEHGKRVFHLEVIIIFCRHLNIHLLEFLKNIKTPWTEMLQTHYQLLAEEKKGKG